jgi:mono/diheme cytochrome c family protein
MTYQESRLSEARFSVSQYDGQAIRLKPRLQLSENSRRLILRSIARPLSFVILLSLISLLAACSLAAPAPVGTVRPLQQEPAAQQPAAQPVELPSRRPDAAAGAALYQEKCIRCHGEAGRGDGAMAAQIQTQFGSPVADLTADVVARARTPEEWYNVVANGRIQNGMPGFAGSLDVDQRWDVIAYAWSLAVPQQQLARGQDVYAEQCAHCHGDSGKGDGKDAEGNLVDLSSFVALAKVAPGVWDQAMASGHVPSFAGTVSEADRRAAIDYIRTFAYDYPASVAAPVATPSTSTGELPPAAPEAVTGSIVLGTPGMNLPADLQVFFEYQRNTDGSIISQTVPIDAQGNFVVTDTQLSHGDLMRARTEYDAITYFSEVQPVGVQATLPITIFERAADASTVRGDVLHVIAQPTDAGLSVNEVYVLSNNAERVIADPGNAILHIGLPAGATQFEIDPNIPANTLVPTGDGLDYFGSFPAASQGSQSIAFSYLLPKGSTQLDRTMSFPIDTINLLVRGDAQAINVSGERFASQGTRDFEGQVYQLFQASNLAAGQSVALNIGPAAAPLDWRILLGIGLIVVGGVGLVLWQRSQKKKPAVDRAVAIQKEALIDQIAALDDEFAEGKIDEINYKAKRAKLKDKLVELLEEE